jgi:hypothetical protein
VDEQESAVERLDANIATAQEELNRARDALTADLAGPKV